MISQLLLSVLFSMCSYMLYVQFLSPFFFISPQDTAPIWTNQEKVETEMCADLLDETKGTPNSSKGPKATDDPVLINEGLAYFGEVAFKESRFYYFPVEEKDEDILIQVSSISGSPDVYISLNNPKPSALQYDFKSQVVAGDVLSKEFRELRKKCTKECTLHIGIFGATASVYNLRVRTDPDSPSLLAFGVPVTSYLNAAKSDFYLAAVRTDTLYLRLQLLEGNADLFLTITKYNQYDLSDENVWKRPGLNSPFSQHGSMRAAAQTLEISEEEIRKTCPSAPCLALVNIVCQSHTCRYMLTVTQDELVQLIDRVPYTGDLEGGKIAYHKFFCLQKDAKITVSLTSLSDVDLELYVSKGLDKRPTIKAFDWYQNMGKEGKLTMSKSSYSFSSGSSKGGYLLGVLGERKTTYNIWVSIHPDQVIPILPGVPVQAKVSQTVSHVYSFYHTRDTDLHLALTPIFGSVGIRVRTLSSEAELFSKKELSEEINWSTKFSGHNDFLTIKRSDRHFCTKCTYVIGVYAENRSCSYSLTAFSEGDKVGLRAGIPHQDIVSAEKWRYFTFLLHDHLSNVDFSLMVYSGDADLYVSSLHESVSSSWTQWNTTDVSKKHISITASESTLGEYTVGVLGRRNTHFSVTASAGLVSLIDGWPGIYTIGNTSQNSLEFRLYVDEFVVCRIRPLSRDFYPQVLDYFPTDVTNKWLYTEDDYDMIYNELIIPLGPASQLEERRIIVSSPLNVTSPSLRSFQIACVKGSTPLILLDDQPIFGAIYSEQDKHRFQIYVSERSRLTFTSATCAGQTSLSISSIVAIEREYSLRTSQSMNRQGEIVTALSNAFGRYYVTIEPWKMANSSFQGAHYDLSFERNSKNSVHSALGGVVRWNAVSAHSVQLKWSPLKYENRTLITEPVRYHVYMTNDTVTQLYSACDVRSAVFRKLAQRHDIDQTNVTEGLLEVQAGVSHSVTVLGILSPESHTRPLVLPYLPTEIYVSSWTLLHWAMLIVCILAGWFVLGRCETALEEFREARSIAKEREKQKKREEYVPTEVGISSECRAVVSRREMSIDDIMQDFVPDRRKNYGAADMRFAVNREYFLHSQYR